MICIDRRIRVVHTYSQVMTNNHQELNQEFNNFIHDGRDSETLGDEVDSEDYIFKSEKLKKYFLAFFLVTLLVSVVIFTGQYLNSSLISLSPRSLLQTELNKSHNGAKVDQNDYSMDEGFAPSAENFIESNKVDDVYTDNVVQEKIGIAQNDFVNKIVVVPPNNSNIMASFIGEHEVKTVGLNFSASEMAKYGMSFDKRYASIQKISDSNPNNMELLVYDFELNDFLSVDSEVTSSLVNWHQNVPQGIIEHFWSPNDLTFFIHSSIGYPGFEKGFLYQLKIDQERRMVTIAKEFNIIGSSALGWTERGDKFGVKSNLESDKNASWKITKRSLKLIDKQGNIESVDEKAELEKYRNVAFYKFGFDKPGVFIHIPP